MRHLVQIHQTQKMKDSHLVMMNSLLKYLVEKEILLIILDSELVGEEHLKQEDLVVMHSNTSLVQLHTTLLTLRDGLEGIFIKLAAILNQSDLEHLAHLKILD